MERLTERYRDYIRIKGCSTLYSREERKGACLNNAVVRLAAYEDTWMEPDDIESLKIIPATNERMAYRALGTVEELSALVKARDEGRLMEMNENLYLAMRAGARAIKNNKRLWGTSYLFDIFGEFGGPKEIAYLEAARILQDAAEEAKAALGGGEEHER